MPALYVRVARAFRHSSHRFRTLGVYSLQNSPSDVVRRQRSPANHDAAVQRTQQRSATPHQDMAEMFRYPSPPDEHQVRHKRSGRKIHATHEEMHAHVRCPPRPSMTPSHAILPVMRPPSSAWRAAPHVRPFAEQAGGRGQRSPHTRFQMFTPSRSMPTASRSHPRPAPRPAIGFTPLTLGYATIAHSQPSPEHHSATEASEVS